MELIEFEDYYLILNGPLEYIKKDIKPEVAVFAYSENDIKGYYFEIGLLSGKELKIIVRRERQIVDLEPIKECYQRALAKHKELLEKLGYERKNS